MTGKIENNRLPTIAVLGGTGKEGPGLAMRWVHAGYPVIIPGIHVDSFKAYESVEKIKALADIIIPNHEPEFMDVETIP